MDFAGSAALIGFAVSGFLAVALFASRGWKPPTLFLACILTILSLISLLFYGLSQRSILAVILPFLVFPSFYVAAPLAHLYVRSVLGLPLPSLRQFWWTLIAPVIALGAHTFVHLTFPEARSAEGVADQRGPVSTYTQWFLVAAPLYNLVLLAAPWLLVLRSGQTLGQKESVRSGLGWLRVFTAACSAAAFFWLIVGILGPARITMIPAVVPVVPLTFFVLYFVVKRPHLFPFAGQKSPDEKYAKQTIDPEIRSAMKDRIIRLMETERPYLNDELKISELGALLDLPPHKLSIVLNSDFGMNFYDFVNSYRVKEAARLLVDPGQKDMPVLRIAYAAGFNSKATFNRAFKQAYGIPPQSFRASQNSPSAGPEGPTSGENASHLRR